MIRFNKFSLFLIIIAVASACSSEKKEEVFSDYSSSKFIPDSSIHLNDGKKWKVESKMLVFIRKIENEVGKELKTNSIAEYKSRASILKMHLDSLTSNCVMEGAAHDELHAWLLPYIEVVDSLNNTTDAIIAKRLYNDLSYRFKNFNYYFE